MKRSRSEVAVVLSHAWLIWLIGFCILLVAGRSHAQDSIDIQALVQETMKESRSANEMTMVWWMPEQFWRATFEQSRAGAQSDEFLKIIRRYTVIAVVDGQMGPMGGVTFKNEEAVRAAVTIKNDRGGSYAPLGESAIDQDMKTFLQIMKPMAANVLGPMGKNTYFLLFPATGADRRPVANAMSEGSLSIVVGGTEFKYRLPLVCLLPPRYDSSTGEKFPGNYNFNPFTGSKLVTEWSNKPL